MQHRACGPSHRATRTAQIILPSASRPTLPQCPKPVPFGLLQLARLPWRVCASCEGSHRRKSTPQFLMVPRSAFDPSDMKGNLKKVLPALAISLLSCTFFCQPAKAATIQGTIDFGGVVTFNTTSLATATKVNLWNSSIVLQDSGDFSSIAPGTNVTMTTPWIFNSGTPSTPAPGPATPALWSVGGFTFDLTSSTIVSQSAQFLDVTGVGTISGNGFNPTAGTWSFTSSRGDGSTSATFGFQSQTAAVPETSTIALVGIGIICLLASKLSRKKAKAA